MLNPDDHIGKIILKDGLYDQAGLYFIEKILAKINDAITLDIGANIGNHALRMSEHSKIVHLFEPQAHIADTLHTTMALNHIDNWRIHRYGLSDAASTLPLYKSLNGNNGETSFIANVEGDQCLIEESSVYVGDEVMHTHNIHHVDFIKIDVEGFEAKVIAGLKNTIQTSRPIIFMEWDKAITKQQFQDMRLFETVFSDYLIKAVTRDKNKYAFIQKVLGKAQRLLSRKAPNNRKVIGEFKKEKNYRHIVFVPREKASVLSGL